MTQCRTSFMPQSWPPSVPYEKQSRLAVPTPAILLTWVAACLLAMPADITRAQQDKPNALPRRTVVFICEHGAAKSVIAAAWFNKLASERNLPFHAVARGTAPQEELSEAAVAGLRADGVSFPADRPRQLTAQDTRNAVRIVAFCPLPAYAKSHRADFVDVPAPKDGYNESRDAILLKVKALLDELQQNQKRRPERP